MQFKHFVSLLILSAAIQAPSRTCQAQEVYPLYTIAEFDTHGKEVPMSKTNLQLLSYIENQLNIKFDVRRVPWKRAIENALNDGGLLMGMSITKERSQKFVFSEAINGNGNWLVALCERTFKYEKLDDLKGKTIGIVSSTSVGEEFDAKANQLFKVEHDTGAGIARLQKLVFKRVDAAIWYGNVGNPKEIEDTLNKNYELKSIGGKQTFCVLSKPVSIVTNHFAMRIDPQKNQIIQKISAAIIKGRKEGMLPTLNLPN
ncbi:MAG: ABC transporter substrate-binding protein [Burkholderiaceae bacterium]|nr:MAG: ABC transporter substrate-binding protein [Burkholderiaceae bacterium]